MPRPGPERQLHSQSPSSTTYPPTPTAYLRLSSLPQGQSSTIQSIYPIMNGGPAARELAFQISEQFAVLGASLNIRTVVIVGGMDMMAQALELGNRPHIVIATPGRIVDHLRSSNSGE